MLCASMAVIQVYRNQPVFASFIKLPLNGVFWSGNGCSASGNAIPWKTRAAGNQKPRPKLFNSSSWTSGKDRARRRCRARGQGSCFVRFGVAFTLGSAFRTVELSDRVGAYLCNAVLDAVAFVFSGAHRSLHHHVGTLR